MERISKFKSVMTNITNNLKLTDKTKNVKCLVVSKTRPIEQILEIYDEGHREFGENYVNELIEKSQKLPSDINWHFIGHLQTNKCKKVLEIKNLLSIESVDSIKLADEIQKQCLKLDRTINIYLQINISDETSKSGIRLEEVSYIFEEIKKNCDRVNVIGIMSLGEIGNIEQFDKMYEIKMELCSKFAVNPDEFILSLGTSDDFEEAIIHGSNEVRIGGYIFDV
jgi:pyridoxal phosphate enzyme (YggS family)